MLIMWIAVDKDNSVWLYDKKPSRMHTLDTNSETWAIMPEDACIQTSKEVMLKLLDKELTWSDEPIEIL